jgi:hypothetical protein
MFENKDIRRIKEVISDMKATIDVVEERMRDLDNIEKINNKLNAIDKRISKIESESNGPNITIDKNTVKRLENIVSKIDEKPKENIDVVSAVRQELLKGNKKKAKVYVKNGSFKYCYVHLKDVVVDNVKYKVFVDGKDLVLRKSPRNIRKKQEGYVKPQISNVSTAFMISQGAIVTRVVDGVYNVNVGDDEIRIRCLK